MANKCKIMTFTCIHVIYMYVVAGSPQVLTDTSDPWLLKHKPLPTHMPIARWGSEYSANFMSPSDFVYERGVWKGAPHSGLFMKVCTDFSLSLLPPLPLYLSLVLSLYPYSFSLAHIHVHMHTLTKVTPSPQVSSAELLVYQHTVYTKIAVNYSMCIVYAICTTYVHIYSVLHYMCMFHVPWRCFTVAHPSITGWRIFPTATCHYWPSLTTTIATTIYLSLCLLVWSGSNVVYTLYVSTCTCDVYVNDL